MKSGFCLTFGMTDWDSAALQHLQAVAKQLRAVDIAALFEEQVRAVWRRNVDAYDQVLGDTPLTLLHRLCREPARARAARLHW